MGDNLIIEMDNVYLTSDRGDEILSDFNFHLAAGRSAVIVGSAGSGKSSLAELLVGSRFADSGSVSVFSRLMQKRRRRHIRSVRRRIGGVGGMFSLIPSFTVAENITFPLVLAGEKKSVQRERLMKMLTEFSMLRQAAQYPRNLTRVEVSLVQFARASVAYQPLMIIDELMAGLDRNTLARIIEYLAKASLSGRSIIILSSEPIPGEIPNCDRFRLERGRLV